MRFSGFAAGAALVALLCIPASAPSTAAAPGLQTLKPLVLDQSPVLKAHGWHRKCRHGWSDVHKHVRGVGRLTCQTHKCWIQNGVQKCGWF